ncbi:3'(2'),5'-bisphosphate nucleotidase CysQ [Bacteroidota bacterium]
MNHFREYMMIALKAALSAGEVILEVYRKPSYAKELKSDFTPVTEADRAAHSAIMEILRSSGFPVLSEEGNKIPYEERKDWETFWLVDPLDGTKEFIRKNGEFTVNIALIHKQKAVLGILYAPLPDLMYYSETGSGAYRMEEFSKKWPDIHSINECSNLSQSLPLEVENKGYRVVASRSHINLLTKRYIKKLRKSHGGLELVSRGSALKFCLVAEGSADIYPRFGPTWEWDTGAGQAIAEAAGCSVSLHDRDEALSYNKENLLNPFFIVARD